MINSGLFSVIKEFKTARECFLELDSNSCDLIIINNELGEIEGLKLIKEIKNKFPDIKIILHSSKNNRELLASSLAYGANSFIKKANEKYDFVKVSKYVLQEGIYLNSSDLNSILFDTYFKKKETPSLASFENYKTQALTKRELEIIALISKGYSNPEIAKKLFITINTVKTQIRNILIKLKAQDRAQAAVIAVKMKLI